MHRHMSHQKEQIFLAAVRLVFQSKGTNKSTAIFLKMTLQKVASFHVIHSCHLLFHVTLIMNFLVITSLRCISCAENDYIKCLKKVLLKKINDAQNGVEILALFCFSSTWPANFCCIRQNLSHKDTFWTTFLRKRCRLCETRNFLMVLFQKLHGS